MRMGSTSPHLPNKGLEEKREKEELTAVTERKREGIQDR